MLDARKPARDCEAVHLLHPAPRLGRLAVLEDGDRGVHPDGHRPLHVLDGHVGRRVADGRNLLQLLAADLARELHGDGRMVALGGLDVEEGERGWHLARHEVGQRAQEHVVGLRHEHVLLGDLGALAPLHKRVRPVEHHVPRVLHHVLRQRVHHHGGDLVHQVVRLAAVQQAREAAHLAPALLLAPGLLLLIPVVVDARLPVHRGALG
mmetsp:Transcript_36561/g.92333  ORF Transcript_36561/g.92333 Transcript_36561/m.92333 type:complete len:208 (+) Transcript_36561:659-1282(+)